MFVLGRKRFGLVISRLSLGRWKRLPSFLAGLCCLLSAWPALAYQEAFTFATPVGSPYVAATPVSVADGTNNSAKFYSPAGITLDSGTNLYMADGNVIRKIAPIGANWVMTTIAGTASVHAGDDGTNAAAKFDDCQGIALGNAGNFYVADTGNNAIRKMVQVGTNWVVTTIAGAGRFNPGSLDGTNTSARFNHPYGIAADTNGNIFVADTFNDTIRKVTSVGTNWVVTTLAGLAGTNGTLDGTNSDARFSSPATLTRDSGGNLYVADTANHTIRKVAPGGTNWVVTTLAGLPGVSGIANGSNSTARFNSPAGITLDSAGRLYVSDSGNSTIRKLRLSGTNWVVSTLAGSAGSFGNVDGIGSAARFDYPYGITLDNGGSLYVTDDSAFTLRLGQLALVVQTSLAGNQMTLSWPLAASNFVLETSSSVVPGPGWLPQTNGVVSSSDSFSFTTNTSHPSAYFRLHKP